jgi:hypothetical protein
MKTLTIDGVTYEIFDDVARKLIGDLNKLNTSAKTDLVSAINEAAELVEVPESGGGLNSTASALLITILRNGVYSTDQSANITALENALASGGSIPDIPDVPVDPEEPHTHSYTSSVTTEATCETAGVRTYTCSCGHSYTEAIPATGHNYVYGTCENCGGADPDYVPSENNGWVEGEAYAIEWTDGYGIDHNGSQGGGAKGAVYTRTDRSVSDFLPCRGASALNISGIYTNYGIFFYDENKNFVIQQQNTTVDWTKPVPVPLTAYYVRVQCITTNKVNATMTPIMLDMLTESTAWESGVHYCLEWEYGKQIKSGTGVETTHTSTTRNVSKYALCMGATTVTFSYKARYLCAFYDADKNYVGEYIFHTSANSAAVPENAVYFRVDTYGNVDNMNVTVNLS